MCSVFVTLIFLHTKFFWTNFAAQTKHHSMDYPKRSSESMSVDEEIRNYIQKKKDENSALKKLLNALESAKKSNTENNSKN